MVVLKGLLWIVALLTVTVGVVAAFGPREPVDLTTGFDPQVLASGVDAYLAGAEAQQSGITPGTEKRMVWADAPGARTAWSVVYLHGFSATSEEIRPVPDNVARALGANLFFTRLTGHGQDGTALAGATVNDWMQDTAEALAIGRATGERVLVIATSTGGTLATLAAADPDLATDVAGIVLVSPNFGVKTPAARILTWPAVRWWGPIVAGAERRFEALNDRHGRYWTTAYPTVALVPMAALVRAADAAPLGAVRVPALFVFDDADRVVDAAQTRRVMARWGSAVAHHPVAAGPTDDPFAHVIAGDILSPGQTAGVVAAILAWAATLP